MKILKFYGYSDDTFGEYGVTNPSVDNCGSGKPIQCEIIADGYSLLVVGQYDRNNNGCWDVGICQHEECEIIPSWHTRISSDEYTAVLEIDVPDDFKLVWYSNMVYVEEGKNDTE